MWRLTTRIPNKRSNPVVRILLLILLLLAGIVAVFFSAVIIVILLLAAAAFLGILYLRARWLRHKLGLDTHPRHSGVDNRGVTLEGEYTVNKPDDDQHS